MEFGLMLKTTNDREEKLFHPFFIGLANAAYSAVRTNLLSQQPLGYINRAYQTLIQEEQYRAASYDKGVNDNVHAFRVQPDH